MIKNKDKVYLAFFNSKKERLYYNQLKDITHLSHSSLQNVLKKLIENKEIKEEKEKSNIYYSLRKKYKAIEFTKITYEIINNLNLDVRIPIQEFIELIPTKIYSCLFFGSASIKQEREGSDLDLLIIIETFENEKLQKLYETEIKDEIEKIKDELNTRSIYHFSIGFIDKKNFEMQNDYLVIEAINKGYPIINQINYYNNEKIKNTN